MGSEGLDVPSCACIKHVQIGRLEVRDDNDAFVSPDHPRAGDEIGGTYLLTSETVLSGNTLAEISELARISRGRSTGDGQRRKYHRNHWVEARHWFHGESPTLRGSSAFAHWPTGIST